MFPVGLDRENWRSGSGRLSVNFSHSASFFALSLSLTNHDTLSLQPVGLEPRA
jgi:hypothetical protein